MKWPNEINGQPTDGPRHRDTHAFTFDAPTNCLINIGASNSTLPDVKIRFDNELCAAYHRNELYSLGEIGSTIFRFRFYR